ncbi:MAG: pyrroloquinoline quinone biosynthesis protein PqqB [Pseudomonadota bacterium]
MSLTVTILGAAAGGGLPQWNCGCPNCQRARAGEIPPATQSSIAVTAANGQWAVVNASPDIRGQLERTPALYPSGPRRSPIGAVLVTNGDLDHVAGLLTLREKQPFRLFATPEIHAILDANPVFEALDRGLVERHAVGLDTPFDLLPGLQATLYAVPGKVPLFLEGETVATDQEGEATVGVRLAADGRVAHYVPGCARLSDRLTAELEDAHMLLFDGTLWHDNEMIAAGLGHKTGRRMGHMPITGPGGSLHAFDEIGPAKRVYVHMNNTNPILDPTSPEHAQAQAAGWTVGADGMVLTV